MNIVANIVQRFHKMKKDRVERKAGLEKKLENLTQSLRTDLEKARRRALE